MKLVKFAVIVVVLAVLVGCLASLMYQLKAQVRIVNTEVEYDAYGQGDLLILYELKNVGSITIDYFKVYFRIVYTDGTYDTAYVEQNRSVPVAQSWLDHTWVYIGKKTVAEVKVQAINLKNYEYGLSVVLEP